MARQAVFLDRDGVLNHAVVNNGLPYSPRTLNELQIIETSVEACTRLSAAGFMLIGVTNQPDIARGKAREDAIKRINREVARQMGLVKLFYCPHDNADNCQCRKPRPGMLFDGAKEFNIDLRTSIMVGDRWKDIEAGHAAGCQTVFIDQSYDEKQPCGAGMVCANLLQAVPWILKKKGKTG